MPQGGIKLFITVLLNTFRPIGRPEKRTAMNPNWIDVFATDQEFLVSTCIPPQIRYKEFLIILPLFQTALGS